LAASRLRNAPGVGPHNNARSYNTKCKSFSSVWTSKGTATRTGNGRVVGSTPTHHQTCKPPGNANISRRGAVKSASAQLSNTGVGHQAQRGPPGVPESYKPRSMRSHTEITRESWTTRKTNMPWPPSNTPESRLCCLSKGQQLAYARSQGRGRCP